MPRRTATASLRSRRLPLAVALSLCAHAGLLLWAALNGEVPEPAQRASAPEAALDAVPVEVEIDWVERASTPPPPSPSTSAETAARPEAVRPKRRVPPSPSAPSPAEAGEAAATPNAPAPPSSGQTIAEEAPVPRLRSLVPRGDFIVGAPRRRDDAAVGPSGDWLGSTGRTITNDGPLEEGTRRAQAEARAREAMARVDGWAKDDLASLRVQNGATDDYFRELGRELERLAQVERPLQLDVKAGLHRVVEGYLLNVEQYGATGAPHMPEGTGQQRHRFDVPDPNRGHQMAAATADQYERVQELARRLGAGELVVIVELLQNAGGRVTGLVIAQSSGDPLFDAHIQRIAQQMGAHEGMPDHVAARSPHGVRTTWEFRGRYSFRKKLSQMDVKNAGDAAYLAAVGLGSLLMGGAFDEVTGDVYIIDVRDPKFVVRSTLLRLY